ncbi:YmaF family protein [Clostridium sp. C8-1-8]|uniref:YmaF family protein n=1 Tax=Clostridium sp. C8-1-8 TaxID=2698831 RepID=UPI001367CCB9|nr:YmaF family protein [Clostridium sp. C8-1-8]
MAYEHSKRPYDDYEDYENSSNLEGNFIQQRHDHEFLGSTRLAEEGEERHNHRFAGVTGQAIPCGSSHVHKLYVNTDFFDHFHIISITTGPAIDVGNGKHVHLVRGVTTSNDGHRHSFIFTTLIESPLTNC